MGARGGYLVPASVGAFFLSARDHTARIRRMPDEEISDKMRRKLCDRFEMAGLSVVQEHLGSGADSALIDRPRGVNVREFARTWAAKKLKAERSRRRRNDTLLFVGTVAAIVAAVFSVIVFL